MSVVFGGKRVYSAYAVTPKERLLRALILGAAGFSAPIPPLAVIGIHAAWVTFTVLASICGSGVAAFYGLWLVGVLTEGVDTQLIGDDSLRVPPLYWPWGGYQKRVRRARRIRALERACDVRDPWPL